MVVQRQKFPASRVVLGKGSLCLMLLFSSTGISTASVAFYIVLVRLGSIRTQLCLFVWVLALGIFMCGSNAPSF